MKRAQRRHHDRRTKKNVRFYHGGYFDGNFNRIANDKKTCGKIAAAKQKCSCPLYYGNPRRTVGRDIVTRQETSSAIGFDEQIAEL